MNNSNKPNPINVKKLCVAIFLIYLILMSAFYFLSGDQLKLRRSRGDIAQPTAEAGTVELLQGTVIEQVFSTSIQRLESISVQWGAFYRTNSGTVTMQLLRAADGSLLMESSYDAAALVEGSLLTMTAPQPLEGLYGLPLILRITADSPVGAGATPLMVNRAAEGWQLSYNGQPVPGALCLGAAGTDYIWTGLHYWEFVAAGGLLLAGLLGLVGYRSKRGKGSYLVNACYALRKYRFLIRQLVSRDFKTKYKRSILGVFWSFLNPLLMMCVQYFVFSTIFRQGISNFAVYLLIGVVCFNFFSESCGMSLTSVLGNAGLITKVYMPKYIYPFTRVISSVINLGISIIPLLLVSIATGVRFQKSALLAFYFFFCLILFSLGLGLLLSASMVFFRDTRFLWNVVSMVWMYATPIFYPEDIVPPNFRWVQQCNPLYHFLKNARICILDGISPEPSIYVYCLLMALAMLAVGALVFYKTQDKFVLYL